MSDNLKMLFVTSRPASWVNTAYPFAAGYLMTIGRLDLMWVVATIFFLIPYNLLMYGVNDVFDYESDMRNPRKGGIEGAVTPKRYHSLILWASVLSCTPFVLYMVYAGTLTSTLVLAVVLFFVVAYSAKGLRFKEIPLLDSITSSMHFVGPLLFALALASFPGEAWPYVVAFFAWGMASQAFGAVQDIIPDREANISSIATVCGGARTMQFAALLYLVCACILFSRGGLAIILSLVSLLYIANIAPFLQITDKNSSEARVSWKRFMWLNYISGAVVTMVLIYGAQQ